MTDVRYDDTAIERIGTVVYSITVNPDGDILRGPWAICDHCGALDTILTYQVDGWGVTIVTRDLEPHACPPAGAPLPGRSVCATRPCGPCRQREGASA